MKTRASDISLVDIASSAATGLLLTASFPRLDWSLLAWFALVPLFFSISNAGPARGFKLGFLAGVVHHATLLYWIVGVISHYGHMPAVLCAGVFMVLVFYLSLYTGLFSMLLCSLRGKTLQPVLTSPFLWVALEYVRSFLLTGFPWENLGYSQYKQLHLIQVSDILGVYGLSALIVAANGAIFEGLYAFSKKRGFLWRPLVAVALLVTVFLAYGGWRIGEIDRAAEAAPTRVVALVQGNIDQSKKWRASFQDKTLQIYGALSDAALDNNPDLIVWPETALPFYFLHDEDLTGKTVRLVRRSKVHFVIGSPSFRRAGEEVRYYNSAYLVDPDGQVKGKYDKVHLVPYGEYVPLRRYLPFLGKMVEAVGDFESGREGQVLEWGQEKIGVLICFEAIFPALAAATAQKGAKLLVNITNDAWFGRSSAPYQHLSMVVFRAVENRLAVARAANTGISAFVDPTGRLLDETPLMEEAIRTRPLPLMNLETFYARHGDLFALGCALASLAVSIGSFWKERFCKGWLD